MAFGLKNVGATYQRDINLNFYDLLGIILEIYRGLVPQVPRVTGYGPTAWIQPAPPAAKWLGKHTPVPGMAPPLLAREGATYLKRTKLRSESHHTRPDGF
jgi:hypothetical protein